MTLEVLHIADYLDRVGLDALPPPTPEGLATLVRAQSRAIAFENLDVLAGIPVRLERAALADKLLRRRRGGYCFELNGLLAQALDAAGFDYRLALARVMYRRSEPGPLSHVVMHVRCGDAEWLVDAGFGGPGLVEPVPFIAGAEYEQNGARFRLLACSDGAMHLQRLVPDEWIDLYAISAQPVLPVDIEVANHAVATWAKSPFHAIFMCARPTPSGLILLQGTDLVSLDAQLQAVEREPIDDATGLRQVLREAFGVEVERDIAERAWQTVSRKAASRAAGGLDTT